mmetsp:Transcript_6484/g.11277  ORF Transcript_6484/g.11277 Transcript_6484/m.11277 type:complete len:542 (-) Transcript_6484:98-1723(-)
MATITQKEQNPFELFDDAFFANDGASSPLSFDASDTATVFSSSDDSFHTSSSSSVEEDTMFAFTAQPPPPPSSLFAATANDDLLQLQSNQIVANLNFMAKTETAKTNSDDDEEMSPSKPKTAVPTNKVVPPPYTGVTTTIGGRVVPAATNTPPIATISSDTNDTAATSGGDAPLSARGTRRRAAAVASRVGVRKMLERTAETDEEEDDEEYERSATSNSSSSAGGTHRRTSSADSSTSSSVSPSRRPSVRRGRRPAAALIAEGKIPANLKTPEVFDPAIAAVALPRQRLLSITGVEMEERFHKLTSSRTLTPAEMKELRRQRRLVKNREYAQQSRNKKKRVAARVDKTIEQLEAENAALRSRLETVATSLNSAMQAASALGASGQTVLGYLAAAAEPVAAHTAKRRRGASSGVAGAVLCIMLFSFAAFMGDFGVGSGVTPDSLTHASPQQQQQRVAEPRDINKRVASKFAHPSTGRALLCFDESDFRLSKQLDDNTLDNNNNNTTTHSNVFAAVAASADERCPALVVVDSLADQLSQKLEL